MRVITVYVSKTNTKRTQILIMFDSVECIQLFTEYTLAFAC